MEKHKSVTKKVYHKNRLTLQQVENNLFNGGQQTTYYFVNRTPLSGMEKFIINYVLNFTQNGKPCKTPYLKIAFSGGYKCQSIEACISVLANEKGLLIKGKKISNKDKKGSFIDGGIYVNLDNLLALHREYDEVHSYEAMVAEHKAFNEKKRIKRDAKDAAKDAMIAEQAAIIEKLMKEQTNPNVKPIPEPIQEDVPDFVIAEVDVPMDKTKPREVEEYIQPKRPPAPNMDREPTPEEMLLFRKRKRVYQVSNGKPSDFLNEMEIDELSKKCKKPGVTPLKILLSCQGYDIGMGKTTFQWKEPQLDLELQTV